MCLTSRTEPPRSFTSDSTLPRVHVCMPKFTSKFISTPCTASRSHRGTPRSFNEGRKLKLSHTTLQGRHTKLYREEIKIPQIEHLLTAETGLCGVVTVFHTTAADRVVTCVFILVRPSRETPVYVKLMRIHHLPQHKKARVKQQIHRGEKPSVRLWCYLCLPRNRNALSSAHEAEN